MNCKCVWLTKESHTVDQTCEVHGSLKRVSYSDVIPGMRVIVNGREWIATDRTRKDSTAWENYEYNIRALVNPMSGKTIEIDDFGQFEIFVKRSEHV